MIKKGSRVRAHFFRHTFNRSLLSVEKEHVCTRRGVVQRVSMGHAVVKFQGLKRPKQVPVISLELIEEWSTQ